MVQLKIILKGERDLGNKLNDGDERKKARDNSLLVRSRYRKTVNNKEQF